MKIFLQTPVYLSTLVAMSQRPDRKMINLPRDVYDQLVWYANVLAKHLGTSRQIPLGWVIQRLLKKEIARLSTHVPTKTETPEISAKSQ